MYKTVVGDIKKNCVAKTRGLSEKEFKNSHYNVI